MAHDSVCNEQSLENNNSRTTSLEKFTDGLSPCRSDLNPSFTGNSSPAQSENNLRQNLKHVINDKVSPLETKFKETHSNALGMKKEIKTLKGELLLWVNR